MPRVEASPDRSDFAKLGETIAASLVQAAREYANHARVLLEQTKQFADDIRSQVAEKSRKLAEFNERGGSIGSTLALSTSVQRGTALNISTPSLDGLPSVSFRPMSFGTTVLGLVSLYG